MPDDTKFVQEIADAEKNGNFKEAFADALRFIYGDSSLLSSDGSGWKDRAQQLSADLEKRHLIPPFNIVDGKGIEVNTNIPTTQSADGAWHADYASGLSLTASADFSSITINDTSGNAPRIFHRDSSSGQYIQVDVPQGQKPQILHLDRSNTDHPAVTITDQQTVTKFTNDGNIMVTQFGVNGEVVRETFTQANGLTVLTEGPSDNAQRKVIRYPDGTVLEVIASQSKDAQGNHLSWTTSINVPNFHGGRQVLFKLPYDITDGHAQLPTNFEFQDPSTQIIYSIDNETLTMSLAMPEGGTGKYYMSGIQPDISNPSTPLATPTATATAIVGSAAENPFVPVSTPGAPGAMDRGE